MSALFASRRETVPAGDAGNGGLRRAVVRCGSVFLFVFLPIVVVGGIILTSTFGHHTLTPFWDFHVFRNAGNDVLHGRSPYPPADSGVLAHENSFVYPAPAALVMIPFAPIPFTAAAWIFAAIAIVSIPVALRIIGVRDYRCYGIALLSAPFAYSVGLGAITPMLLVGVALVWRYRDRRWIAAAALASVVMLKLFLWPLLLWLAFTRRVRTALLSVLLMGVVTLASWAVLGFAGLRSYSNVLNILTHLVEGKGFSLVALGLSLDAAGPVARALPWIAGAVLMAIVALRGREPGADPLTFVVSCGAALALSPIVWLHYFLLLYIPIGIVRPRLSWLWALPLAFWICRGQSTDGVIWHKLHVYTDLALTPRVGDPALIVFAIAIAAAVLALSARIANREART
jgi:alpha-1,2-mannosyltransferase